VYARDIFSTSTDEKTCFLSGLGCYDQAGEQVIARQQRVPAYYRNGIACAIRRSCLLDQQSIMGERAGALVLNEFMVSNDTYRDLKLDEFTYTKQRK